MDGKQTKIISQYFGGVHYSRNPLSGSHHAGVPPTELGNLPIIPASAYAAALKEYEDLDETDSEGDGLSW